MIIVKRVTGGLTLERDGLTFTITPDDIPGLVGAALDAFGVKTAGYQAGYAVGHADGLLAGYQQRDREYVLDRTNQDGRRVRQALIAIVENAEAA